MREKAIERQAAGRHVVIAGLACTGEGRCPRDPSLDLLLSSREAGSRQQVPRWQAVSRRAPYRIRQRARQRTRRRSRARWEGGRGGRADHPTIGLQWLPWSPLQTYSASPSTAAGATPSAVRCRIPAAVATPNLCASARVRMVVLCGVFE